MSNEFDDLWFNQTELRIVRLTSDGEGHSRDEIKTCFNVKASNNYVSIVIAQLRAKLRKVGQDIVCQSNGRRIAYRRVRHLRSVKL